MSIQTSRARTWLSAHRSAFTDSNCDTRLGGPATSSREQHRLKIGCRRACPGSQGLGPVEEQQVEVRR